MFNILRHSDDIMWDNISFSQGLGSVTIYHLLNSDSHENKSKRVK